MFLHMVDILVGNLGQTHTRMAEDCAFQLLQGGELGECHNPGDDVNNQAVYSSMIKEDTHVLICVPR